MLSQHMASLFTLFEWPFEQGLFPAQLCESVELSTKQAPQPVLPQFCAHGAEWETGFPAMASRKLPS